MIPTILSLVILTAVEISPDGSRVELRFDAPGTWSQSMGASPARLIIDLPGAGPADGVVPGPDWTRSLLSLAALQESEGVSVLGVEAGLPPEATARAHGEGATLIIERSPMPILMDARPQPAGGHFAACEQPQLFVEDLRHFARKVRS